MRSARSEGESDVAPEAGVYAAMELLGQRWMLRVVWELEPGPLGFLELRRRMGNCSSSMLADRLAALVDVGIVEKLPDKSYELTAHRGMVLGGALEGVWAWADENAAVLVANARKVGVGENARRRH